MLAAAQKTQPLSEDERLGSDFSQASGAERPLGREAQFSHHHDEILQQPHKSSVEEHEASNSNVSHPKESELRVDTRPGVCPALLKSSDDDYDSLEELDDEFHK